MYVGVSQIEGVIFLTLVFPPTFDLIIEYVQGEQKTYRENDERENRASARESQSQDVFQDGAFLPIG